MTLQATTPLVSVAGHLLDPLRVIVPLSIAIGRSDPSSQPDASACSFDYLGTPDVLTLDADVEVYLDSAEGGYWGDPPGGVSGPGGDIWTDLWSPTDPTNPSGTRERMTRFRGRITDLDAELAAEIVQTKVTCIGRRADLGNVLIGDVPWPQETETARVARVVALIGTAATVTNNGSAMTINPRDVDRQTALDVLETLAGSTGALLYELPDGTLRYDGYQTRSAAKPNVSLTEFQILDGVGWMQSRQRLIQIVSVVYGLRPVDGSDRTTVYTQGTGRVTQRIDSDLTLLLDAQTLAATILARWSNPAAWDAPQVHVPMTNLPSSVWGPLMAQTPGDLLTTEGLSALPAPPTDQEGQWFIEGWIEDWDRQAGEPLEHAMQFAVSDFARWRTDTGDKTTTTATVVPASAGYGTARTVTAHVVRAAGGAAVSYGSVSLVSGTSVIAGPVTPDATGTAVLTVSGTQFPAGTYPLTVKYAGRPGLTLDSSCPVTITVTPSSVTSTVVSMTPNPLRDSQTGTAKATVTPSVATGYVQFASSRDNGATWQTDATHYGLVNGVASRSWTTSPPDWLLRATYVPDTSNFQGSTSPAITVDMQALSTQTLTYAATWAASYQQDGDKRSDTSDCFQGYYSSTNGNQKSLAGFAVNTASWTGYDITKVEVYLYFEHWYSNGGGTAIIGASPASAEPASWPSGVATNKQQVSFANPQGKWVDITSWAKAFATGGYRAIALGPGPSTSSAYYGDAIGTGSSRPQLRITGQKWT